MTDIFAALAAPFPPDAVSWRVGSTTGDKSKGMALAYIDSRDVQDRFDAVVGPGNWQRRHPHVSGTTTCEIDVWCEGRGWVTKTDGAGDTDVEAEKGSLSDSFKRAAVNWGVGRYLYGLDAPWVELEPAGRSFKIKKAEFAKLRRVLTDHAKGAPGTTQSAGDGSGAKDLAVKLLNACKTLDELKEVWIKNAKGWQELMAARDFEAVERAKESVKIALSATVQDPFSEAA